MPQERQVLLGRTAIRPDTVRRCRQLPLCGLESALARAGTLLQRIDEVDTKRDGSLGRHARGRTSQEGVSCVTGSLLTASTAKVKCGLRGSFSRKC